MIKFFLIPEKITIGIDAETRALLNRFIDVLEQPAKIEALTKRLQASGQRLAATVVSYPDPDPND